MQIVLNSIHKYHVVTKSFSTSPGNTGSQLTSSPSLNPCNCSSINWTTWHEN